MLMLFGHDLSVIARIDIIMLIGIAMVGGLLLSWALTPFTMPVVYLYLDRLSHWASPFAGSGGVGRPGVGAHRPMRSMPTASLTVCVRYRTDGRP